MERKKADAQTSPCRRRDVWRRANTLAQYILSNFISNLLPNPFLAYTPFHWPVALFLFSNHYLASYSPSFTFPRPDPGDVVAQNESHIPKLSSHVRETAREKFHVTVWSRIKRSRDWESRSDGHVFAHKTRDQSDQENMKDNGSILNKP